MSFWRLHYHLVWATKHRQPLLSADVEAVLYPFLLRKAEALRLQVHAVNGWFDHVHVVASIRPTLAVSDVVKALKGASSHHLNDAMQWTPRFQWQRGYGAHSVGERQLRTVIAYVERQKTHHARGTINARLERATASAKGVVRRPAKRGGAGQR